MYHVVYVLILIKEKALIFLDGCWRIAYLLLDFVLQNDSVESLKELYFETFWNPEAICGRTASSTDSEGVPLKLLHMGRSTHSLAVWDGIYPIILVLQPLDFYFYIQ